MNPNSSGCFTYSKDIVDSCFTCSKCNAYFPEESDLWEHMWGSNYKQVMLSMGNAENVPSDNENNKSSPKQTSLDQNQVSYQTAPASPLPYDESLPQEPWTHEQRLTEAKIASITNYCPRCQFDFDESFQLHEHMLNNHRKKRLFKPDNPVNSDSEDNRPLAKRLKFEDDQTVEKVSKKRKTKKDRKNRRKTETPSECRNHLNNNPDDIQVKAIITIEQMINSIDEILDEL